MSGELAGHSILRRYPTRRLENRSLKNFALVYNSEVGYYSVEMLAHFH